MEESDFTFCGICGRRVEYHEILGKCMNCRKPVCTRCGVINQADNRVYCVDHAPPPPQPPEPPSSSGCFIATAAYGTPFAQEIQSLRHFRDHQMSMTRLGRSLIHTYYRLSPPIAAHIATRNRARRIIRLLLNPLVQLIDRLESL
jgi:hypothetical protein